VIVNIKLHLTDDTELRAHGFVASGTLVAEVAWDFPIPDGRPGEGSLWGSPAMLRQLAELAVQAAIQAEEEACWHAHQAATRAAEREQVA
jgi:hypothetical protein